MTSAAEDPTAGEDATVGELSEGEILSRVLARLGTSHALVGPGDDAAVLAAPDGRVVATTDTLVQGPDFRLAWTSGFDLGWKAARVLSAIACLHKKTPLQTCNARRGPEMGAHPSSSFRP